jgi:hypothetical protein
VAGDPGESLLRSRVTRRDEDGDALPISRSKFCAICFMSATLSRPSTTRQIGRERLQLAGWDRAPAADSRVSR